MALEAVPAQQDPLFGHLLIDLYNLFGGGNLNSASSSCIDQFGFGFDEKDILLTEYNHNSPFFNFPDHHHSDHLHHAPPPLPPPLPAPPLPCWESPNTSLEPKPPTTTIVASHDEIPKLDTSSTESTRPRRRRRTRSKKNIEELENQRMTHIAVERNRRKQMNDYLAVIRELMPESYVQRGDQASIIGGAINYVKELEQKLQILGGEKQMKSNNYSVASSSSTSNRLPFGEFFSFPQYRASSDNSTMADIEVTMVESHGNIKIRTQRRPKQLLKLVSGLQNMRITILHLNVTTVDPFVFYSLSVKIEDVSELSSAEEIATALDQLMSRIHQEAFLHGVEN